VKTDGAHPRGAGYPGRSKQIVHVERPGQIRQPRDRARIDADDGRRRPSRRARPMLRFVSISDRVALRSAELFCSATSRTVTPAHCELSGNLVQIIQLV